MKTVYTRLKTAAKPKKRTMTLTLKEAKPMRKRSMIRKKSVTKPNYAALYSQD